MANNESKDPGNWKEWSKDVRGFWKRRVYWCEWVFERIEHALSRLALVKILDHAAKFGIVVAVISYLLSAGDRERDRIQRAWQVIYAASGKGGDGGRWEALTLLIQRNQSLSNINLSKAALHRFDFHRTPLHEANLSEARLVQANLSGVQLGKADLRRANLRRADLDHAFLRGANLSAADLSGAVLDGAELHEANLSEADLNHAFLRGAHLSKAILNRTDLTRANLNGASLLAADLSGANLNGADLGDVELGAADLSSALNLSLNQVLTAWSWDKSTKFPPDIEKALIEHGERERIPPTDRRR